MFRRINVAATFASVAGAGAAASATSSSNSALFFSRRAFTSLSDLKKDPEATLPQLHFDYKLGIPPVLSARQVELHYTKHHKAYIDKLNAIAPDIKGKTIEAIADEAAKAGDSGKVIYNQAAQHFNHTFYWKGLAPNGCEMPKAVADDLAAAFGSVDEFKTKFAAQVVGNFGSGWTWLVWDPTAKKLLIWNSSNAVMPQTHGLRPVFTVDGWEHAWYKDFENLKANYAAEIWKIVNWNFVGEQLVAVKQ